MISTSPQAAKTETFILINKTNSIPGTVNQAAIAKLNEPLKAIAAYYSSMEGSNCNNDMCELTTALGLGKQGSDTHINLIKKWFHNDKTAKQLIAQRCYLGPNSAST